jgi:hypothetical protein
MSADSNGYTTLHHAVIAGLDRALPVTLCCEEGWTRTLRPVVVGHRF